jgi:hypothetical protein
MYLRAAASWQCVRWDAPVAATVSPGSAPPILRRTARAGSAVCAHGHRDRTGHHDNTSPPQPSQVEARLSTVVPTANGPARPRATTSKRRWIIHRVTVPSPGGSVTSAYSSLSRADPNPVRRVYASAECKRTGDEPLYSDSDWALVAGAGRGAVAWTGHAGAAGPTRRNRNRSRDSAPCPSRDGGGGSQTAGCWPAPVPDSDGVSRRHCGPTAMRTCARSNCGRAGRGPGLEVSPRCR